MKKGSPVKGDFEGVFAVPPLARNADGERTFNLEENLKIVGHIAKGGISRFIYGGNAFIYHVSLAEYEQLLEWSAALSDDLWIIPAAGPSFGRAIDQSSLIRKHHFPCVMLLPCNDPRDPRGLEQGVREIADRCETSVLLYLKEEDNFGANREAGLDAVARLVDDGVCVGIKYAVVRTDPTKDSYLESLLTRVDRGSVVSGIGERPAIDHMRAWQLPGFTTGSGCLAPRLSSDLFRQCVEEKWDDAARTRQLFLSVEDLRDALGPARVLHAATEIAGIANTGPIPPFVSGLSLDQYHLLSEPARALLALNSR